MPQNLTAAVGEYRRSIHEETAEVQRLRSIVADLESAGDEATASRLAASSLRRARADVGRAESALAAIKRDYARFRLRHGLGHDPSSLDDETFDAELLAISASPLSRDGGRYPRRGAISFQTFRAVLLAEQPLGQLIENERAQRKSELVITSVAAETRNLLRRWAARTASDPHVAEAVARARAAAERFDHCLAQFQQGLNDLRINYEIRRRHADRVTFHFDDDTPVIQATNEWENIERVFPETARRCVEHFYHLRRAQQELTALRERLNAELRAFMGALVPRYVHYVTRQAPERRRRLGRFHPRRLCEYLLTEVENVDLLLPEGGGIGVPVARIPRRLRAFRRTRAFREYRKAQEPPRPASPAASPGERR